MMKPLLTAPRKLILPFLAIALLVSLFFVLGNKSRAPDVMFITIEGKTIKMADLKGKMVLVDFWATDCPGCIVEMPKFAQTYAKYHAQGFEMVAVAMPYDPPEQVMHYSKKAGLPFPVMHDTTGEMSSRFGDVNLTPTAFIIDKQGKVIRKIIGDMDFASLHQLLNTQLAGKS